jgi:hypothetical protein
MGIDPRIILAAQGPQIEQTDPLARYGKILGIKNALGQGDLQGLQLQSAQQGMADEQAMRQAYQESGGDSARLRALLTERGQYKGVQALDKFDLERRDKEANIGLHAAQADKSKYDVAMDKIARGSSILSTARDQPSYDSARRLMAMQFPEIAQNMPPQFDPNFVQQQIAQGQTIVQRLTDLRAREQQAETARGHTLMNQRGIEANNIARERLNLERDQPRGVFDPERGVLVDPRTATARPVTMAQPGAQPGGAPGAPLAPKTTEAQKKELMSIDQQIMTIDGAMKGVKANPSAFSLERGAATMIGPMAETIRGRMDSPEQRTARSYVFNVVSKVINERAGAAQSVQELARLRSFLPAEADNAQQIEDKLKGFKTYLSDLRKGTIPSAPAVQPAPSGLAAGRFLGFEAPNAGR